MTGVPIRWAYVTWASLLALGVGRVRAGGPWMQSLVRSHMEAREAALQRTRPYPDAVAHPWIAGREPDGTTHIVAGTMRVDAVGQRFQPAGDRLADTVTAAVPVRDGWVFVGNDGIVAHARTFTGPLRVIGTLPCGCSPTTLTRGRMVARTPLGAWWSTDGSALPARLTTLPPALSVAFMDASHGAAALEGGGAAVTADGGASWTPLRVGAEAVWEVTATMSGLRVATTNGVQTPGADGSLTMSTDQTSAAVEEWPGDRSMLAAAMHVHAAVVRGAGCAGDAGRVEVWLPTAGYTCRGGGFRQLGGLPPGDGAWRTGTVPSSGAAWIGQGGRGGATRVSWRGRDELGTFQGVAHAVRGGGPRWPGTDPHEVGPWTVAATRAGVMVAPHEASNVWWWASTEGGVRQVPAIWGRAPLGRMVFAPTQDLGMAIAERTRGFGSDLIDPTSDAQHGSTPVWFTMMEVRGFDGTVRGRRAVAQTQAAFAGLARYQGAWGVATSAPEHPLIPWFHPAGGGDAVELAAIPGGVMHACVGPSRPEAELFVQEFPVDLAWGGEGLPSVFEGDMDTVSTIERTATGVCIRRVGGNAGDVRGSLNVEAAAGDTLVGTLDYIDTETTVRCTATADAHPRLP